MSKKTTNVLAFSKHSFYHINKYFKGNFLLRTPKSKFGRITPPPLKLLDYFAQQTGPSTLF